MILISITPEPLPLTLALVGDIMLGRGVSAVVESGGGAGIFNELEPWLKSADFAFGNLESPVSASPPANPGPYNLCAGSAGLRLLSASGFDILSTANNHRGDCLEDGPENARVDTTESRIASAGMKTVSDSFQPPVLTARGMKVAFLAGDDVSAPVDLPHLLEDVKSLRQSGAFVVVSMHWGLEYQAGETKRQAEIARRLAGAGANLIIGHHPHVTQPEGCITGGGDAPGLVFYSLGNALFDQHGLSATRRGWLAFTRIYLNGSIAYSIIPLEISGRKGDYALLAGQEYTARCMVEAD